MDDEDQHQHRRPCCGCEAARCFASAASRANQSRHRVRPNAQTGSIPKPRPRGKNFSPCWKQWACYDSISVRQERAIITLLSEPTLTKAADAAGVGRRTLQRWMDNGTFAKAYRKARRDAFGQSIALTQHYAPLAVNTLATIMADKQAPAHARVTAAASLLKFGRDGIERDDLAIRVEALEEAANQNELGRGTGRR